MPPAAAAPRYCEYWRDMTWRLSEGLNSEKSMLLMDGSSVYSSAATFLDLCRRLNMAAAATQIRHSVALPTAAPTMMLVCALINVTLSVVAGSGVEEGATPTLLLLLLLLLLLSPLEVLGDGELDSKTMVVVTPSMTPVELANAISESLDPARAEAMTASTRPSGSKASVSRATAASAGVYTVKKKCSTKPVGAAVGAGVATAVIVKLLPSSVDSSRSFMSRRPLGVPVQFTGST